MLSATDWPHLQVPTELRVVNRLAGMSTAGFLYAILFRIVLVQSRTEISDSGITQPLRLGRVGFLS